jgi:HK97 family phage prohead protease
VLETAPARPLLHRAAGDGGMPTLFGHFARWGEWTEIDSAFEGRFMESVARGAFARSIRERRDRIRVLFQHGADPFVGDKPLGPIQELREDAKGAGYVVPMLDTTYNRDLVPGLDAGLYGASFRFRVMREEFVEHPATSDRNPGRLPERTLREVDLLEFGPCTFPAYCGATAGLRGAVRDSNATPKRGRASTVITPRKRMEVKRRDGRVVEVLTPGRDRFSLDHEYVRANPGFFTTLPAATAEARATLARMQGRPGHTRAGRRPLGEALAQINSGRTDMYGLAPRRVLPSRTPTTAPVLPRRAA